MVIGEPLGSSVGVAAGQHREDGQVDGFVSASAGHGAIITGGTAELQRGIGLQIAI
jgi:hypothetical protein